MHLDFSVHFLGYGSKDYKMTHYELNKVFFFISVNSSNFPYFYI